MCAQTRTVATWVKNLFVDCRIPTSLHLRTDCTQNNVPSLWLAVSSMSNKWSVPRSSPSHTGTTGLLHGTPSAVKVTGVRAWVLSTGPRSQVVQNTKGVPMPSTTHVVHGLWSLLVGLLLMYDRGGTTTTEQPFLTWFLSYLRARQARLPAQRTRLRTSSIRRWLHGSREIMDSCPRSTEYRHRDGLSASVCLILACLVLACLTSPYHGTPHPLQQLVSSCVRLSSHLHTT